MPQMTPNYPYMTSSVNEVFIKPLVDKYGSKNVIWPIVLIKDDRINKYLYEINNINNINGINDNRPESSISIPSYLIDYSSVPRRILPDDGILNNLIDKTYSCSYEYITQVEGYFSVDLDYVWYLKRWKGIELTTLWMPLKNKYEAERLIKMFSRRPSWNGPNGPHGIRKQIAAANDLKIDYWMVCVNSEKGVSNSIVISGNAFWFKLTNENINRILNKEAPVNSIFGTFDELLAWL